MHKLKLEMHLNQRRTLLFCLPETLVVLVMESALKGGHTLASIYGRMHIGPKVISLEAVAVEGSCA